MEQITKPKQGLFENSRSASRNHLTGRRKWRDRLVLGGLSILLVLTAILSLGIGRYGMSVNEIFATVRLFIAGQIQANSKEYAVLFSIRMPRIVMSVIVGASLAAAGASYQGLFKNPMVSPDLLGVSSGASVGACLGLLLSQQGMRIQVMAFLFGLAAVFLVLSISSAVTRMSGGGLLILVLAGTVISSLCSALTSLMKYLADTETKLPEITFWLMGSFAKTGGWRNVLILLVCFLVGVVPLLLLRWKINVMAFGEEEAQAMGVDTKRVRLIIILSSTLLTASSVALCGVIGWVGLVVPHIARFLVGPNYLSLLPCSMLIGGGFMLIVDNAARSLTAGEIPLGILTSIIGAPIFIYLLFKGKRSWSS